MNAKLTLASAAGLFLMGEAALHATPLVDFPTEEEALQGFFPGADSITKELGLVADPDRLKLRSGRTPRHLFRQVARKDGRVVGYAVVSEVMGKARPITYMLAVDAGGSVLGIEVLVYRESHGGEIGRSAFRRQFEGKDAASKLKLGDDIRNIAGATISCRAITSGVADLLDVLAAVPGARDESSATPELREPTEPGDGPAAGALARVQVHMNAPLSITLTGPGTRAEKLAATEAAFAETRRLEALFSAFLATSDIARLNAHAGGAALAVAPETRELLEATLALSRRTDGAFDPAAGSLVRLVKAAGPAPKSAALHAAHAHTGARWLELGPEGVRLSHRGAALDLGAAAKGATLDRLAALLASRGITGGVLNFGGQVLAFGPEPVHVESREGFGALKLLAGSLATSGDSQRALEAEGASSRSHVVDPRTAELVTPHGAVQVFAARGLEADALATALYVMGPKQGLAFCEAQGIAARFGGAGSSTAWHALFGAAE